MTSQNELQYNRPVEPADPNAEYLTMQETAAVFRCSVKTIRRLRKELGLGARIGSRVVFDRDERRAMFNARRVNGEPMRVPTRRHRRTARKPAEPRIPAQRAA
jgi:hypothetical protein